MLDKGAGTATTGSDGTAQFCYTAQFPGADTIEAVVDANKNGSGETTEPTGTATKTYVLPVSTPLCQVSIDNGGWIIAANGDRANFGGNAEVSSTCEVKGEQVYIDNGPASQLRMKSTTVLAVVCSGTTARIYGRGTLNDSVPVFYRIQVTDGGKGGKTDKYGILLSTGYYSGDQRLQGGNITVRIGQEEKHRRRSEEGLLSGPPSLLSARTRTRPHDPVIREPPSRIKLRKATRRGEPGENRELGDPL